MKVFPNNLHVKNKDLFENIFYVRLTCYLRRDIYEHILKEPENNYFSLDKFNEKYVNDMNITRKLVKEIIKELEKLKWKCELAYGDTGLFIYSSENPPTNYWG